MVLVISAVDCSFVVNIAAIVETSKVLLAMFDVECSSVVVASSSEEVGCSDVDKRFVDAELCEVVDSSIGLESVVGNCVVVASSSKVVGFCVVDN